MKNISFHAATVTIFVRTKHEHRLEFVLDQASDRALFDPNRPDIEYYSELYDMLDDAVAVYGSCREVECYGDVDATIGVSDYNDIPRVLEICDTVVAKWIAKYNINQMVEFPTD